MIRLRGRGHWKTTTFVGAIRASGCVVPLVVDGAINGKILLAWVEQHLTCALQPDDIVIMDNLSSHKVKGVKEAIESADVELIFFPPYSPDLNPIEMAFAKSKRLIRFTKERAVDSLWKTCGQVLDAFSETEMRNYFKHAGYRYT